MAIARVLVINQQRRIECGQPFAQQVVGAGAILLQIVVDEVAVTAQQKLTRGGVGPKLIGENFELQRKIEQVIFETVAAKAAGAVLRICVDAALNGFAKVGGIQPGADFAVRKADNGSLVEIINNLRIEPVAVNRHRFKIAFFQQRAHDFCHVILSSFERQKLRRLIGVSEPGSLGGQRPEGFAHAPRQPAERGRSDLAAGSAFRAVEQVKIRLLQQSLRRQN